MPSAAQIRTLSSAQTIFMKFVLPITWIPIFGIGALSEWRVAGSELIFPAMWIIGTIVLISMCAPLKRVRIDEKNLYISNYIHEITVPLDAIKDVTEIRWININPVTIYFSSPTQFGKRITFMPKIRFSLWAAHPVVSELKQHIVQ
jgi:hypothetical protein